jgi:hypothetical protein
MCPKRSHKGDIHNYQKATASQSAVACSTSNRRIKGDYFCANFRLFDPAPASLLARAAMIAALLTAAHLMLFMLSTAALIGLISLTRTLSALAHVIAVLNHVLAAQAANVVSYLCHKILHLTFPPRSGLLERHRDLLCAMPSRAVSFHINQLAIR